MQKKVIYIIGSLKNRERVIKVANQLEAIGYEAFADWTAPGPDADDYLRDMAKARGWNHIQTLRSYAAKHVCAFDKLHLDRADATLVILPCGKSCHLEAGYMVGQGKPVCVLMEEAPERVDVMYNLVDHVADSLPDAVRYFRRVL